MPHNLANVQPLLRVSSLSLVKPGGKRKTLSLVTPQQACNELHQHCQHRAECHYADAQSPFVQQLEGNSPTLPCVSCTLQGLLIYLSFSLSQHCGMQRVI